MTVDMLQVYTDTYPGEQRMNSRGGKKKPYQSQHPHSHHHRRVRAQPEVQPPPPPEPEIQILTCQSSEPEPDTADIDLSDPNDPFEKHFLAAALAAPPPQHGRDGQLRSSSFRSDKQKPHVIKRESADMTSSGNYSSSPNLLFPKDDMSYGTRTHEPREAPLRRVRSFKTTSKGGVVNRGDSFRKKNSSRNVATGSTNGHESPHLPHAVSQPSDFTCPVKTEEPPSSYFKVQLVGAPGCGKTSITNQFMSSDYANVYDSMNGMYSDRLILYPDCVHVLPLQLAYSTRQG